MTTIHTSELRLKLSEVGHKVAYTGERYVVECNNKPLFAVVPITDMELLEHLEDQMDLELMAKALKSGKFTDLKDLKKELKL